MSDSTQNQKSPLYVSFCTQKGGAGKSIFTILAASYLYYEKGYSVAIIDCDYPQWSVKNMREREKKQIEANNYYKKKAYEFFTKTGNPAYKVVPSKPESAMEDAKKFLAETDKQYDLILFDLPGTVNNNSVVQIYFKMDYLFVPITISRINMESTLFFVTKVNDILRQNPSGFRLKHAYTFWNRKMSRDRKELFEVYGNALSELEVSIMQTGIPNSVKYDREQSVFGEEAVFLSTIFPPDKKLLTGSNWDLFMGEFLELTNLKTD